MGTGHEGLHPGQGGDAGDGRDGGAHRGRHHPRPRRDLQQPDVLFPRHRHIGGDCTRI